MPRNTSSPLSSLHTQDHHSKLHLVQYGLKPEKTSNNLLLSQNTCLGAPVWNEAESLSKLAEYLSMNLKEKRVTQSGLYEELIQKSYVVKNGRSV
jgi:hypothetical protein